LDDFIFFAIFLRFKYKIDEIFRKVSKYFNGCMRDFVVDGPRTLFAEVVGVDGNLEQLVEYVSIFRDEEAADIGREYI